VTANVGESPETTGRDGRSREVWTVLRMILWSADYLRDKGIESGRLDAEHLLAHVAGVDRLQLYLDFERPLSRTELDAFRPLLKRRAGREPLQYIIGKQSFRELELEVRPGVLIPRPETELLVELVLEWVAAQNRPAATALDVGTGTGAIALSLAFEGAFASVVATDVSSEALDVARKNRDAVELEEGVDLRLGSLFDPLEPEERFDVIVSNPPYVPEVDRPSLQPEVRDWEPGGALFAGSDGLDVLRQILQGARAYLKPGGLMALEVGFDQARYVADLLEAVGGFEQVRVVRDYSKKERFVLAHAA
jgi:release factor glutamine methyltransferase